MDVMVFVKEKEPATELTRRLSRIIEEIEHEGFRVDVYDPDTRKGKGVAETYEVVITPTVLVLRENGSVVAEWRGSVPVRAGDLRYFLGHEIKKVVPSRILVTIPRVKAGAKKTKPKTKKANKISQADLIVERVRLKRGKSKVQKKS